MKMKRYCPQSVAGQIKGMVHANVAHKLEKKNHLTSFLLSNGIDFQSTFS